MKWRLFGIVAAVTVLIYAGVRLVLPQSSSTTQQETQEIAEGGNLQLQVENPPELISQAQTPPQTYVSPSAIEIGGPEQIVPEDDHTGIPPKVSAINAPITQPAQHYDKNNWPPGATGYIYSKDKGYTWAFSDSNLVPADSVVANQTKVRVISSDAGEMYFGQRDFPTGGYIEIPEGARISLSAAQDYARLKYGSTNADTLAPSALEQALRNPGQAFALSPEETEEYLTNFRRYPYNATQRILNWENISKKTALAQYEIDKRTAGNDHSLLQLAGSTFNLNVLKIETRANRLRSARDVINKLDIWDREQKLAAFDKVFLNTINPAQPLNIRTPPTRTEVPGTRRTFMFDREEDEDNPRRKWIDPTPNKTTDSWAHIDNKQVWLNSNTVGGLQGNSGNEQVWLNSNYAGGMMGRIGDRQVWLNSNYAGGFTGRVGNEQVWLNSNYAGGMMGRIGDRQVWLNSNYAGGFTGRVGNEQVWLNSNYAGGMMGRIGDRQVWLNSNYLGGYWGNVGSK